MNTKRLKNSAPRITWTVSTVFMLAVFAAFHAVPIIEELGEFGGFLFVLSLDIFLIGVALWGVRGDL